MPFDTIMPSDWLAYSPQPRPAPIASFERFIGQASYPCVGAKSALGRGGISYYLGRDLRSGWDDLPLAERLQGFAAEYDAEPELFRSFVAIYRGPRTLSEAAFETALWARLQSLHAKDVWLGHRHDPRVSADPASPDFSFSLGGRAFFVVGLHPRASRPARRFAHPTLVFNLHDQFARLRADGRYRKMRETILQRDRRWTGSINPMLAEHGSVSEARQYSGRRNGEDWTCPFHPIQRQSPE